MEGNVMERLIKGVFLSLTIFFCLGACVACNSKTTAVDVNKDGKSDVIYYHDGENITKIQADTNYDGTHDVVVYIEDGKFKEAHIDTDYDGAVDKKIEDTAQFKQWVNDNRPDFNDHLGWDDYSRKVSKVFWNPGERN
jgi:hypothetical protein